CSWCRGLSNGNNFRHCTNVSFRDEPVYDSNPNSYNQTPNFCNPPPYHNYEIDLRFDTRAAFQAEFAKFQQNFKRLLAQLSCSNCGGVLTVEIIGVYTIDHQEDLNQQWMNDVDNRWNKMIELGNKIIQILDEMILKREQAANLKDIESKASSDSNLDEPALLVTPLFNSNEDEFFDPRSDVDEINAFNIPSDFKDGYYDSEGDVLYLESFIYDDTTPNLPPKDNIFDPGIFAFHFSSLELMASHQSGTFMCFNVYPNILNERPMEICSSTRFNHNIMLI
nr:hypothetical protein [Tanacetum cinerariifolium]